MPLNSVQSTIWKLTSGGNDFIAIDNRDLTFPQNNLPALAASLCDRRFGIGADGFFLLEPSKSAEIFMHFFNADGTEVGVCGNALRCTSHLARHIGRVGDSFSISTIAETYKVEMNGADIRLTFPPPRSFRKNIQIDAPGLEGAVADLVDVGVPHLVIYIDEGVDDLDLEVVGKYLRHYEPLGPDGANANFIEQRGASTFRQRTYERGVEGETLACGSGAASSAYSAVLRGRVTQQPIEMIQSGGGSLRVEVEMLGDVAVGIHQFGTARAVMTGEVIIDPQSGTLVDPLVK